MFELIVEFSNRMYELNVYIECSYRIFQLNNQMLEWNVELKVESPK